METISGFLPIVQIIISIILIVVILMQNRGAGLGGVFGGSSGAFRTKRGIENTLHILTIVFSVLFLVTAFANVVL